MENTALAKFYVDCTTIFRQLLILPIFVSHDLTTETLRITFHLNKWQTDWRFGTKCMDCMPIASCMSLNIPGSVSQFPPYLVHLQVIQALLSQGIITHAQYMSLMYMTSVVCILFSIFRSVSIYRFSSCYRTFSCNRFCAQNWNWLAQKSSNQLNLAELACLMVSCAKIVT